MTKIIDLTNAYILRHTNLILASIQKHTKDVNNIAITSVECLDTQRQRGEKNIKTVFLDIGKSKFMTFLGQKKKGVNSKDPRAIKHVLKLDTKAYHTKEKSVSCFTLSLKILALCSAL